MTPEQWQRAKAHFHDALERPQIERIDWLKFQLADDPACLKMVVEMLAAEAEPAFETPALPISLDVAFNPDWPSGKRVGSYQILRKIGSGGVGEVYLAERADGIASNLVAIKRLQRLVHPELAKRFLAERQIISGLEHPNIARFLDAGADEDRDPYAVLEYLPGASLTDHVRAQRMSVEQRLRLFLKVANAVSYAHQRLVVHRDLKPGNILLDAQEEPKLLDFGIAKVLSGETAVEKTAFEFRAYTPGYAAPEQLLNEDSGTACDIYALGALLYELLTDQPAFDLKDLPAKEVERRVLEDLPAAPSRRAPANFAALDRQSRADLDNIVLHALKKQPSERYRSAESLASDIEHLLRREPISLLQDHRWYRLRRFVGRHVLALGLGGAALLTLLIGVIALYLQGQRVAAERDRAELARIEAESAVGLLTRAFSAADPSRNRGDQVSARQVLDLAAIDLRQSGLTPQLKAVLLIQLAEVYRSLGSPNKALELLDQLGSAPGGLSHGARVNLYRQRAEATLDLNQIDAAQQALQTARAELASNPGDAIATRMALQLDLTEARLQIAQGERGSVVEGMRGAYQRSVQALDPGDELRQEIALRYAEELQAVDQFDTALEINLALLDALSDPDHSSMGRRVLGNLTRIYRKLGSPEQALAMAQRHCEATLTLYGNAHLSYASALDLLARSAADAGELGQARESFSLSLAILEALGTSTSDAIRAMAYNNFALFLISRLQDADAALSASNRALEFAHAALPPRHPNVAVMLLVKAEILQAKDRDEEAVAILVQAESVLDEVTTESMSGATLAEARLMLAEAELARGNREQAQRWRSQIKVGALNDDLAERAQALHAALGEN